MTIITRRLNGGIVLEAGGRLVAGGPEFELEAAVRRAIDGGCGRVTIGLSAVSTIDAAGVGAIAAVLALARERRVPILLADPSPRVRTLLSITGVGRTALTIAGTRTARPAARGRGGRPSTALPSGS